MLGLITDRDQAHVDRRNALAKKGWNAMSAAEKAEWTGNILSPALAEYTGPVNLLPNNNYSSGSVALKFSNKSITVSAQAAGTYLYAVVIVGNAADYVNKTLTLSVDSIVVTGGGKPQIAAYWHDANGYESAGASLTAVGSVTFNPGTNPGGRANMALYIYVTTSATVSAGASVRYGGVMLEAGSTRHAYVPYTQALPTAARKGAYNYNDLNRVEMAVAEISEELSLGLVTKTDWTAWDIPKQADMKRFLGNIQKIRTMGAPLTSTPKAPASMSKLSYSGANDIEKILVDIYASADHLLRCGEIYCGEV